MASPNELPLDKQVRQACTELERLLRAGKPCRVEELLASWPAVARDADSFLEVVYTEYVVREELGERPRPDDWYARFPDRRADLEQLFQVHATISSDLDPAGTAADDSAPPAVGRQLGPYELLGEVGRGGMGVVYRARHTRLGRLVALKVILDGADAGREQRARFRTEAQIAAQLDHPNFVPIYEVSEQQGQPYFTMKLFEHGSLAQHLGPFVKDPRAAADLLITVARAVHHAHQAGLLHRDLKPANVLLEGGPGTPPGHWQPHITDFGLARRVDVRGQLTQSGAIVGTLAYMAPEQAAGAGQRLTTAVDVYALGAILYELLTGRVPFVADAPLETLRQLTEQEPVAPRVLKPGVDAGLEAICLKCLHKDPRQRYASADALAADLQRWRAGEPISVQPPSLAVLLRLWVRQNFGAAGWAIALGLAWGSLGGLMTWLAFIVPGLSVPAQAYQQLPGVPAPLLAPSWQTPFAVSAALYWSHVLASCFVGLAVVLLVRPRSLRAAAAAGAATGFVAAVVGFTLSGGWIMVIMTTLLGRADDVYLVSDAAWPAAHDAAPAARDRLLEKYPDLADVPADQRGRVFANKLLTDLTVGIPLGIWIGMPFILGTTLALGILESLAAAALLRRYGSGRAMLIPYVEVVAPSAILVIVPSGILIELSLGIFQPNLWYLLLLVTLPATVVAVLRGAVWPKRLALHLTWLTALAAAITAHQELW